MTGMSRRSLVVVVAAVATAAVIPLVVTDGYLRHVLILGALFAVLAASWDLTIGYAGVFNFAHISFFAGGAYAAALAVKVLGLSPWLGLVGAAGVAAGLGAIAFVPAFRMRGVYVALTTFALTQLLAWLILSQRDVTGGSQGIVGLRSLDVFGYPLMRDGRIGYVYAAAVLLLASVAMLRLVARSNLGKSLIAVRDAEEYAQARGVNVGGQQLLAFCLSAIPAGLAGAFYAHYIGAVTPELFGFPLQALLLSMVWFGGVATIYGPAVAGLLLTAFSEWLAPYGPWRFIAVSVLIVLTIRLMPGGLWGLGTQMVHRLPSPLARRVGRSSRPGSQSQDRPAR